MTTTHLFVHRLLSGTSSPYTLATVLVAALALGFGPAAFAQESEEEELTVRVMVIGDGPVQVLEERHLGSPPGSARSDSLTTRLFEKIAVSAQGGVYLGVELVNLNEPLRAHFGVPAGSGVLVSNVVDDSPAARAGVQVGDILTRFDGEDVASSRRLTAMVRRSEAGDPADLEIWRDGKVETLSTTLDERPRQDLKPGSFFFLRGREDLDGDGELDAFVGPEKVHEKIQEYFNGDEWKERHEHVQRFLHERRPDMKALEERLEALKARLAELEGRLEERAEEN